MPSDSIIIKPASSIADANHLLHLVEQLAKFEDLAGPDNDAKARFIIDGFESKPPKFSALLAYLGESENPVGGAIYFDIYSTFLCKPTLYLEDLIVLPENRSTGVGKALLSQIINIAKNGGYGRVEWACLDWNVKAQEFYSKIGARHIKEWLHYRMDEQAIDSFIQQQ